MKITFFSEFNTENGRVEKKILVIPNATFAPSLGDLVLDKFTVYSKNWNPDGLIVYCKNPDR